MTAIHWRGPLSALALALLLAGCAASQAFKDGNSLLSQGQTDAGLAKLQQAVDMEPANVEYRITLASRRASIQSRLLIAAQADLRDGHLSDAEKGFVKILHDDPANSMAKQGLEAITIERQHKQVVAQAETIFAKGDVASLAMAQDMVHQVLAANPDQADALNLKARIQAAQEKEGQHTRLAEIYRKPVTLEFRDAPLRSVLDVISKVSGLSFFFDKDVRPDLKATVIARNTSVEDAVRLLLVTNQLEQKVLNDNTVLIYPATAAKQKDYQTLAVRTFFLTNADTKAVSSTLKSILKVKDMNVDERLGMIVIRDTPDVLRMADRLVALQDVSDPEVSLEVEVLEIKRTRLMELGVKWPSQLSLAPLQIGTTPLSLADLLNINKTTTSASIGSLNINAQKSDDDSSILANPRIRVRNKEKAKILIGDRVPVFTTTSTSTGFISDSVNYIDVGLKLDVEPAIYLNDEVAIRIGLEVSSLVQEITSKNGTQAYQIGTRGANTVLRLKDGETQILAGLINDQDRISADKVPGLGEMPLIGRLFGSRKDDAERTEILLSITPHIVRTLRRPDLQYAEFDSGTESSIGAETLHLSNVPQADKATDKTAKPSATDASAAASAPAAAVVPVNAAAPATTPAAKAAAPGGNIALVWQAPAQVKVGEQFSAVLRVNAGTPVGSMPLLLGYDAQSLQVVSVQEGDFFKQGGGQTSFSQRVDPAAGKIYAASVRKAAAGGDSGINGSGSMLVVTFKALKANVTAKAQVLSASAQPESTVGVPPELAVKVNP